MLAEGGNAIDATLAMAAVALDWCCPGSAGSAATPSPSSASRTGGSGRSAGAASVPTAAPPAFYRDRGHSRDAPHRCPGGDRARGSGSAAAPARRRHPVARGAVGDRRSASPGGIACTAKNARRHRRARTPRWRTTRAPRRASCPKRHVPAVGSGSYQRDLAETMRRGAERTTAAFYRGELAERAWPCWTGRVPRSPARSGRLGPRSGRGRDQRRLRRPHGAPDAAAVGRVDGAAAGRDSSTACSPSRDCWAPSRCTARGGRRRGFRDRFARAPRTRERGQDLLPDRGCPGPRETAAPPVADALHARIDGDTTTTVVVDAEGRAVSFIHSLAFTFGARITVPGTGVVLNNRLGRGAYLVAGHPNEVAPAPQAAAHPQRVAGRRRPDGLRHVGNSPAATGRCSGTCRSSATSSTTALDPQTAVSLPRLTRLPRLRRRRDRAARGAARRGGAAAATLEALRNGGHRVREVPVGRRPGGSALAISGDHDPGVLPAGADPRMEGIALGV